MGDPALLEVLGLRTHFFAEEGVTRAVDGISFHIKEGETLGMVGESGCGKTVTALSILRLLPRHNARIVGGQAQFEGSDLVQAHESQMRRIRGNRIAMIFQEPMTSLNPLHTIGDQIGECVRIHSGASRAAARARAEEMLHLVHIPDAQRRLDDYPHQFSGGMRQRAMIAMALACSPRLLIADEPTTALDVTIQAQILRLMVELKARLGAATLLITHNLGVVAEMCQRVVVMYAGRIVEEADVYALFDRPTHPYTRALLQSVPGRSGLRRRRLPDIPGTVPSLRAPIAGCSFAPRCGFAFEQCKQESPAMRPLAMGHCVACWRAEEVAG